jgi:hypothetical protein
VNYNLTLFADSVCTNFECKGVCLPALTEAVCEENSVSEIVEVHNDSGIYAFLLFYFHLLKLDCVVVVVVVVVFPFYW